MRLGESMCPVSRGPSEVSDEEFVGPREGRWVGIAMEQGDKARVRRGISLLDGRLTSSALLSIGIASDTSGISGFSVCRSLGLFSWALSACREITFCNCQPALFFYFGVLPLPV